MCPLRTGKISRKARNLSFSAISSIKPLTCTKYFSEFSLSIIKPKPLGIQEIQNFDIRKLEAFIDWSPFFRSWELHGKYPDILTDNVVGEQATELFFK